MTVFLGTCRPSTTVRTTEENFWSSELSIITILVLEFGRFLRVDFFFFATKVFENVTLIWWILIKDLLEMLFSCLFNATRSVYSVYYTGPVTRPWSCYVSFFVVVVVVATFKRKLFKYASNWYIYQHDLYRSWL